MTDERLTSRRDLDRIRQLVGPRVTARRGSVRGGSQAVREVLVCAGGSCVSCASEAVADRFEAAITAAGLAESARLVRVGCMGLCDAGPLVLVSPDGVFYPGVDEVAVGRITAEHLAGGRPVAALELVSPTPGGEILRSREVPFFARQQRVALRNCGVIDPSSLEEYVALDGFQALAAVLDHLRPEQVIDELKRSGLRGRGGAGFPAGLKWQIVRDAPGARKYVVCNADEGDPGAFMDRALLEGDPLSVLEAMTIAGRVVGAELGYVYVRAEYPLAVERLGTAITAARRRGLLGADILGSGWSFDIEIRFGAGAFVCGEETALMRSIEGGRGVPRPRPPFPADSGLFGCPTLVGNVETWANVPPILHQGAAWFAATGTPRSTGTKVFALSGAVRNTGLVEVPMGTPLREVVMEIGGGVATGGSCKAILIGGPSGGCVPPAAADVAIEFESLQELGAMMGSGGLVVLDDRSCMVGLARFLLQFCVDESCGKCTPCRIGTRVLLNLLDRICSGRGEPGDIERLERLSDHIRTSSLCGLGQTAPNPTLSTLRHFRSEYEAHIVQRQCAAGECSCGLPPRQEDQARRDDGRRDDPAG